MTKSGQSIFKPALAKDIFNKRRFYYLMQLANKVAVVTGASGDLGKKILQKFSEEK